MLDSITIEDVPDWEEVGPDADPACRLLSHLVFLGIYFHVEAYQVKEGGSTAGEWFENELNALYTISGAEGENLHSVQINERRCVVVIYPFCEYGLSGGSDFRYLRSAYTISKGPRAGERYNVIVVSDVTVSLAFKAAPLRGRHSPGRRGRFAARSTGSAAQSGN